MIDIIRIELRTEDTTKGIIFRSGISILGNRTNTDLRDRQNPVTRNLRIRTIYQTIVIRKNGRIAIDHRRVNLDIRVPVGGRESLPGSRVIRDPATKTKELPGSIHPRLMKDTCLKDRKDLPDTTMRPNRGEGVIDRVDMTDRDRNRTTRTEGIGTRAEEAGRTLKTTNPHRKVFIKDS